MNSLWFTVCCVVRLRLLLLAPSISAYKHSNLRSSFLSFEDPSRHLSSLTLEHLGADFLADGPSGPTDNRQVNPGSEVSMSRDLGAIDPATYYADWHRFLDGGSGQRCYHIPNNMSLCQNIGYSRMILPNFLQHEDLKEAVDQSQVWVSLAHTDCHPDLKKFLCALYAPICMEEFQERLIHPCIELCEDVKQRCLPKMLQFGFGWPDIVKCTQFPMSTSKMCVPLTEEARPQCSGCVEEPSFENVISSYCMADVVIRARILQVSRSNSTNPSAYILVVDRHVKPFKMKVPMRKWMHAIIEAKCHCDILDKFMRENNRRLGKWLIMGKLSNDYSRFSVEHLSRIRQQSAGLKHAIHVMRQQSLNLCRIDIPKTPTEKPVKNTLSFSAHTDQYFSDDDLKSISSTSPKMVGSRLTLRDELSPHRFNGDDQGIPLSINTKPVLKKSNRRRSLVRRSQKYALYPTTGFTQPRKAAGNHVVVSQKYIPRNRQPTTKYKAKTRTLPETEKDLFSPSNLLPWLK